jgi:pyruvate kinase
LIPYSTSKAISIIFLEFLGLAKKHGWLESGDRVVVAAGKPVDEKMNMVEVREVR